MSKKDAILASIFLRCWWILVDFGSQVGTENLAKWGLVRSGQVRSWRSDQVRSGTSFQVRFGAFVLRDPAGLEGGEGLPRLIRVGLQWISHPDPNGWFVWVFAYVFRLLLGVDFWNDVGEFPIAKWNQDRPSWGHLGAVLGASWGCLGVSWGSLGGVLGGLGGVLGRSWGGLGGS